MKVGKLEDTPVECGLSKVVWGLWHLEGVPVVRDPESICSDLHKKKRASENRQM